MLKDWFAGVKKGTSQEIIAEKYYTTAVKKYDAIIAGAGPAGATAAYFMAREGMDVLLLERGPYPGAKTCGGSSIIAEHVHKLFPNFWEELEYERLISHQAYWIMTEDDAIQIAYRSTRLSDAPYNRFSVRRVKLYEWLVKKATAAGATVRFNHHVSEILYEGNQAVGVRISKPQDCIYVANIIILADGANSLLAEKAGLSRRVSAHDLSLYAKETIALPAEVIEERFSLPAGHGAIIGLIGYPTAGFNGTASIHTFRTSININVGLAVADIAQAGITPHDLIDRLKAHQYIKPLIKDGITTEYGANVIPEGGYFSIPELVHPGSMIIGDAASLVNGVHGFSLAMWSGFFAAQAASKAKKHRDFSVKFLRLYQQLLDESFVMQDLRANAPQAKWLRDVPYFFDLYSRVANEAAYHITKVYTIPKKAKRHYIFKKITSMQPIGKMLKDAWSFLKVIR
ncbi:MAG: FAD-dependent oxidoreductase [Negativicutes bacterium]|nr:FAD-dependent oxidoreductase [Negativicutes bacterium]